MKINHVGTSSFFIINRETGEMTQVPIDQEKGILRQLNELNEEYYIKKEDTLDGKIN